jgi:O-succinylbenzoic acid--CoA ligase
MDYNKVHPNFKWNGIALDYHNLLIAAYDLMKEGEEFERITGEFILEWFNPQKYIIVTTSGTTGVQKKIKIEKQAMVFSALATAEFFDLKAGNRVLNCLSTNYIAGKMMLIRSIICGFELDFVKPSSNPLKDIIKIYDFVAMVPLQVENSLNELINVKKLIVGGAKINENLRSQLLGLSTLAYETYGMTETITHVAAKKISDNYFSVLPNVSISIDTRNCLVIDVPRISNSKIITNDIVNIISKSEFEFLGRVDNVINSAGVKLFPEQIEMKLANKIQTRFFVIGIPDDQFGELLALIVEGSPIPFEDDIFNDLLPYEKPKTIHFLSNFLETESGKIKRAATLKLILID